MVKVQIDGPFTKEDCASFIEDIANTDGVTLNNVNIYPSGVNIFNVMVVYTQPTTNAKATKESEQK